MIPVRKLARASQPVVAENVDMGLRFVRLMNRRVGFPAGN